MAKSEASRAVDLSLRLSSYAYVLAMTAAFAWQAAKSASRYLEEATVEDVSLEKNDTGVMPAITFCTLPGYNKSSLDLNEFLFFSGYCSREEADFRRCMDRISFDWRGDLVGSILNFPIVDLESQLAAKRPDDNFPPSSRNLMMGPCLTYRDPAPRRLSKAIIDLISFDMSPGSPFLSGWSLAVFVHNDGAFVPSLGMDERLAGQQMTAVTPEKFGLTYFTLKKVRRVRLNTKNHRCNADPNYNVASCMEEWVHRTVGCASPWDAFPHQYRECQTFDDFNRLMDAHLRIYNWGTPQFINATECLSPCEYVEYRSIIRTGNTRHLTNIVDYEIFTLGVSLSTTDVAVVRDTLLHGAGELLAEIGGLIGMFLGVSLVSFYRTVLAVFARSIDFIPVNK